MTTPLDAATQAAQDVLTDGNPNFDQHIKLTTQKVQAAVVAALAIYLEGRDVTYVAPTEEAAKEIFDVIRKVTTEQWARRRGTPLTLNEIRQVVEEDRLFKRPIEGDAVVQYLRARTQGDIAP